MNLIVTTQNGKLLLNYSDVLTIEELPLKADEPIEFSTRINFRNGRVVSVKEGFYSLYNEIRKFK